MTQDRNRPLTDLTLAKGVRAGTAAVRADAGRPDRQP
ncbi:hypothetical protein STSP_40510 [Streptomyces jeddahensis]|uniref:Uncharacterized protein n=1 Tax=Streptomyces jeddahensis TaxID=1716141 RepID=A0A177HP61_9ACTN|nr:hypothetical protein STSP_40510 [Streptomyces jeddahensis]